MRDAAACEMLQVMNSGHDGSLCTGHANSTRDMLRRLETLVLMGMDIPLMAVRNQIASAIDIVIHLGRLRDRSRRVMEISEITGIENGDINLSPLFLFEETGEDESGRVQGALIRTGNEIKNTVKFRNAGIKQWE